MMTPVLIGTRAVGPGHPALVVAEAGVNHNGDVELAHQLVEAAAAAQANAVKFQTWHTDLLTTRWAPKAQYQLEGTPQEESQFEMSEKLELDSNDLRELRDHASALGLLFFSTPFDTPSVDILAALDVTVLKIPSGEIVNLPLLRHIGRFSLPVILSTGMSTLGEVEDAIECLRAAGSGSIILLHCLSSYPAPEQDMNLRAMQTLSAAFRVPVGLSDHTRGLEAAIAAVALGANVIEKHLTVDRNLPGPDHQASLDPGEFRLLVEAIRRTERMLGDGRKRPMPSELNVRSVARRSVVAARNLKPGTRLVEEDLMLKRPGTGLGASSIPQLVDQITRRALLADELLRWEDVESP